jgi:hypothetical protein
MHASPLSSEPRPRAMAVPYALFDVSHAARPAAPDACHWCAKIHGPRAQGPRRLAATASRRVPGSARRPLHGASDSRHLVHPISSASAPSPGGLRSRRLGRSFTLSRPRRASRWSRTQTATGLQPSPASWLRRIAIRTHSASAPLLDSGGRKELRAFGLSNVGVHVSPLFRPAGTQPCVPPHPSQRWRLGHRLGIRGARSEPPCPPLPACPETSLASARLSTIAAARAATPTVATAPTALCAVLRRASERAFIAAPAASIALP